MLNKREEWEREKVPEQYIWHYMNVYIYMCTCIYMHMHLCKYLGFMNIYTDIFMQIHIMLRRRPLRMDAELIPVIKST